MLEHAASRLQDYPFKTVRLACRTCERQERFNKDKLIAAHGSGITMLDLQSLIAVCDRRRGPKVACGAFYPDLITEWSGG